MATRGGLEPIRSACTRKIRIAAGYAADNAQEHTHHHESGQRRCQSPENTRRRDKEKGNEKDTPGAEKVHQAAHRRLGDGTGQIEDCNKPSRFGDAGMEGIRDRHDGRRNHGRIDRIERGAQYKRRHVPEAEGGRAAFATVIAHHDSTERLMILPATSSIMWPREAPMSFDRADAAIPRG